MKNKSDLIIELNSLLTLRKYNYDGTWLDIELGAPLCYISATMEENSKLFDDPEIKNLFDRAMKAVEELVTNNADKYSLLWYSLVPGRKLYPDQKKHWWWWIPEKVMNEEQLKEWKTWI